MKGFAPHCQCWYLPVTCLYTQDKHIFKEELLSVGMAQCYCVVTISCDYAHMCICVFIWSTAPISAWWVLVLPFASTSFITALSACIQPKILPFLWGTYPLPASQEKVCLVLPLCDSFWLICMFHFLPSTLVGYILVLCSEQKKKAESSKKKRVPLISHIYICVGARSDYN